MVEVVDETRRNGKVLDSVNTTYITLIPKVDRLASFNEYRLIPLCNLLYKVVSKIIADKTNLF